MNFQKVFSVICMWLGVLCIMAAAAIVWRNYLEDERAGRTGEEIVEKIRLIVEEAEANAPGQEPMPSLPYMEELQSPVSAESTKMPTIEIGGLAYIGYLQFLALGVEFPIMAEWDYERLKIAPCRYYGSVRTNDLVIAGHNYKSTFGMLSKLQEGDCIIFTEADGTEHFYQVMLKEILGAAEIETMTDSEWDLSLFTCTYDRVHRLTVRCREQAQSERLFSL